MKKSTIVRTILVALVLLNMGLKATGHEVIDVSENEVGAIVEFIISALIVLLSWWKNNSYTKNAQKADLYLEKLREMKDEDNTEENDSEGV